MSLVDVYRERANGAPDRVAVRYRRAPYDGHDLTWGRLWRRSGELADKLPVTGGRYAVLLADHPDLLPALLAVWRVGGVAVPLDAHWGEALRSSILDHSRAEALVAPAGVDGAGFSVTRLPAPRPGPALPPGTALISYTSGSTSDPKGVLLRHANLMAAYRAGADAITELLGAPARRFGCAMRMSGLGVLGMNYLWPAVLGASTVVLPELSLATARGYWRALDDAGVDLSYLVPPLVELLNRTTTGRAAAAGRAAVLAGGAPLPAATQQRFQELSGVPLLNAYGLTEASFAVFFGDLDRGTGRATPSIGRPAAGVRVTVADGRPVPRGGAAPGAGVAREPVAEGELALAGPVVMAGYYDNPDATRAVLRDGWLHTGDRVRRDERGRYFITGRLRDVVLRGAFTVHLSEVDDAAAGLPGVVEAAAVPVPVPVGEDFGLIVRGEHGLSLDPEAIRAALERALGRERAPRLVVVSPRPLPRVGQGKINRNGLRGLWEELTDAPGR